MKYLCTERNDMGLVIIEADDIETACDIATEKDLFLVSTVSEARAFMESLIICPDCDEEYTESEADNDIEWVCKKCGHVLTDANRNIRR